MAFEALFAGSDSATPASYPTSPAIQREVKPSKAAPEDATPSYSWSRRALHYRFNRESYRLFKQKGSKLEF